VPTMVMLSLRAVLTLNEMKGKELKPSTLEILHFVQNDTSCQIASVTSLPRNDSALLLQN